MTCESRENWRLNLPRPTNQASCFHHGSCRCIRVMFYLFNIEFYFLSVIYNRFFILIYHHCNCLNLKTCSIAEFSGKPRLSFPPCRSRRHLEPIDLTCLPEQKRVYNKHVGNRDNQSS